MTNKHATTFRDSTVESSGQDEDRAQTRDAEQTLRSIIDGLDATFWRLQTKRSWLSYESKDAIL